MGPHFNMGGWRMGWWSRTPFDTVADCTAEVGRSATNWEALCQVGGRSRTALTQDVKTITEPCRAVCCAVVCWFVVLCFVPAILSFLPNRVLQYFLPPTLLHQVFCLCDGTSTRPLHGHVLGGDGAMPKMDGTSTSGQWTWRGGGGAGGGNLAPLRLTRWGEPLAPLKTPPRRHP